MAIDISRKVGETYLNEDQRWLKGGTLHAPADDGLLDLSAFTAGTHYPNGYFPSGLFVGRITATGLLGPYSDAGAGGLDTCVGILLTSVPVRDGSTGDIGCALAVRCDVITNYLPTNSGITTAARADLTHVRFHTYNVAP